MPYRVSRQEFIEKIYRMYGTNEEEMTRLGVTVQASDLGVHQQGWRLIGGWWKLIPEDHRKIRPPNPGPYPTPKCETLEEMQDAAVDGGKTVREMLKEGETLVPCTCRKPRWCRGWRIASPEGPTLWERLLSE